MVNLGFLGKNCIIDRSLENLDNFIEKLEVSYPKINLKNPLFLNQIHSDAVVVIDDIAKIHQKHLPKADALVTNLKNLPICVITADCVPIIFFDEINEIIAIAHAGWRGAKAGIIENTIQEMLKLGAKIEHIQAQIGPCIRQDSYEISVEFYDEFTNNNPENAQLFKESSKNEHFMFNLIQYCIKTIHYLGIKSIKDVEVDTYKSEKDFFSYRRSTHKNEKDCGRNISFVFL